VASIRSTVFTVWPFFLPRSLRVCSSGFWGPPMCRSVPSGPTGGRGAPVQADHLGPVVLPSARPSPSLGPQPPPCAWPTPSRTGWGHLPACAASPAAPPIGWGSADGPGSGPSRTAVPAPRGGGRSSGRRGETTAEPPALVADRSCRSGWDHPMKLLHGETRQSQDLRGAGLDVGES
jgi:hypothetical protein